MLKTCFRRNFDNEMGKDTNLQSENFETTNQNQPTHVFQNFPQTFQVKPPNQCIINSLKNNSLKIETNFCNAQKENNEWKKLDAL